MGDIEGVIALERQIETLPHWALSQYLAALASAETSTRGVGTWRCLFVATGDGALAGVAVGRVTALDAEVLAELESVGVGNSARRKGVARALCEAVIEWARGQGAAEIELEVRSRSDGAIELYRGLGFEGAGMRKRYYRAPQDDAVLMRLDLSGASRGPSRGDLLRE